MMKKIVCGLLAAAMTTVAFSGCGLNTANGSSGSASAGTNAAGATKITIWSPTDEPPIESWWTAKIKEFNEQNKGKIELTRQAIVRSNSYAYEDKVNAAVTSGGLPDILYVDGPNVSNYAANGITVPLNKYFSADDLKDFVNAVKVEGTYNNKLYSLSATESSVALYYNKDMTDAAGIKVPTKLENAWTWSQFRDVAKKLTKNGVVGTNIIMDKGEGLPYVLEQFWISNGTDFVSKDGSKANGYINSSKGIEAAQFLKGLIKDGYAHIDPVQKEFHTGKAATMLGGSWEVATLKKDYPNLHWGVTYFPVADHNGKATSPTGDWSACITKDCKNPDVAGKVLQFLMNKENVTSYAKAIAKLPTRISSYDTLTEYNQYPLSLFKEQSIKTGTPRPRTPSYTVLSPAFSKAMLNIFTGADVKQSLDKVANDFDKDYTKNYAK